jgi:hypothetical protein
LGFTTPWAGPSIKSTSTDAKLISRVGKISPDPLDTSQNYTLNQFLSKHKKEKSLLLNPYFDNPATFMAYEVDNTLKEVKVIPSKPKYSNYMYNFAHVHF